MATEETNQPKSLSIVTITDNGPDLADQVEIREGPWENVKSLFVGRKEIALDKIHSELDRVQAELDDVLASIDTQPKHGFHLTESKFPSVSPVKGASAWYPQESKPALPSRSPSDAPTVSDHEIGAQQVTRYGLPPA